MSKPMIRIHNTQTNKIVDREMTDEEFAIYQKEEEEIKAIVDRENLKKINRESAINKLLDLGLTEDEVKAFLG